MKILSDGGDVLNIRRSVVYKRARIILYAKYVEMAEEITRGDEKNVRYLFALCGKQRSMARRRLTAPQFYQRFYRRSFRNLQKGGEKIIEMHYLTKKYKDATKVNDLSLKISPGFVIEFLGPNGEDY